MLHFMSDFYLYISPNFPLLTSQLMWVKWIYSVDQQHFSGLLSFTYRNLLYILIHQPLPFAPHLSNMTLPRHAGWFQVSRALCSSYFGLLMLTWHRAVKADCSCQYRLYQHPQNSGYTLVELHSPIIWISCWSSIILWLHCWIVACMSNSLKDKGLLKLSGCVCGRQEQGLV